MTDLLAKHYSIQETLDKSAGDGAVEVFLKVLKTPYCIDYD